MRIGRAQAAIHRCDVADDAAFLDVREQDLAAIGRIDVDAHLAVDDQVHVAAGGMTGSTFSTQLLGSSREYEYQVDGERLLLVTRPPTATPPPPGATVKVESESARVPCP